MGIKENLIRVRQELPPEITLVAVSKTMSPIAIREAYDAGQRDFGENRVQELVEKQRQLPDDIRWHYIGHLQTNKIRPILPFVYLIHSVDSLKLLSAIEAEAVRINRTIDCLLEIRIASEETKYGLLEEEALTLFRKRIWRGFNHIRVRGLMGMASFTTNRFQVSGEFDRLSRLYKQVYTERFTENPEFSILSMGMSGDFKLAIQSGTTMVRIGSLIFGARNNK